MDIDVLKYMLLATLLITERSSYRGAGPRTSLKDKEGDSRAETVPPCLPAEAGCDIISRPFLHSSI